MCPSTLNDYYKQSEIVWYDTHTNDDWTDLAKIKYKALRVTTVGHIVHETKGGIAVISTITLNMPSVGGATMGFGITHIPRGCIKSIRELV